jgi:hypothetical protein
MRGLARGQAVQLELDHHGRWTAHVEAVMPDRVAIATLARLPLSAADLTGTPARLVVITPGGLARVQGVVLAADRAGVMELAVTDEIEIDQRRHHVRISAAVPGVVAPRDEAHPPLHTFTLDVSGGGLLVAGAGPAEIGAPVAVTLKLPDRDPLRTDARVARRTADGHVGLVFEGITVPEREALVRWIFERQRLERQAARDRR